MNWALSLCVLSLAVLSQAQTNTVPSVIVLQPPASVNAFVAHTVRISCAAYGNPLPSDILWTGPGGSSITTGGKVKIYTNSQTVNATGSPVFLVSTLEICGVTVADSGQYSCTASSNSVAGSVGDTTAYTVLTVTDEAAAPPAMVVIPPATASVKLWDNMQLMCVAYGNPLPTITWSGPAVSCDDITDKSCNASANVTVRSTTVEFGGLWFAQSVLQFCSIEEEGQYSCSASNGLSGTGLAPSSASILVTVIIPPEPSTEPSPTPSPSASSSASLSASFNAGFSATTSTRPSTRPLSSSGPTETGRPTADTILGVESETAYIIGVVILALIAALLFLILAVECVILCIRRRGDRKFDPAAVHMSNTGDGSATIN